MTKREAINMLMALKEMKGMEIHQVDVYDDTSCSFTCSKGKKGYYGNWNPVDGVELEYAGRITEDGEIE
jgi:hypothetical protein